MAPRWMRERPAYGNAPPEERLALTEEELWTIHDQVRQHDNHGKEWDEKTAVLLMAALLEAHDRRAQGAIGMQEGDLWQVDRQVPSTTQIGTREAKATLLPKVIKGIMRLQDGEMEVESLDARPGTGDVRTGPVIRRSIS